MSVLFEIISPLIENRRIPTNFFTITALRRLAFQLAERKKLKHQFHTTKAMADKQWLRLFLKRQTSVYVRFPEPTSYARATGFNRPAVFKFFNLLDGFIQQHHLDASTIYNCDETGMKTVQ